MVVAVQTSQKLDLEVVRTDSKLFQIFPLDKTQKRYTDVGKTYIYDRKILLDTSGVLPLLPIRLYAGATHMSRSNALSPYTEDRTSEDVDYAAAPLCFDASIHSAVFSSMGLTEQKDTLPYPLFPAVLETLSRLRFQVILPQRNTLNSTQPVYDTFIARPDETALMLGELSFRHFSPQDSPTL